MKAGSEAAFQQQVMNLARLYGWRVAHFHDSRRQVTRRGQTVTIGDKDAAGFPDLVLVRGPELIFAELKTEKGRTTPDQDAWLADLQAVSDAVGEWDWEHDSKAPAVDVYLWKPSHFDEITERLARGRHTLPPLYRSDAA